MGSVFSPYYALTGRGDPANHCAINVALYGQKRRWTMTERGRAAVRRAPELLAIGPSSLGWHGNGLSIEIAETCAPLPHAIRGAITVIPDVMTTTAFALAPGHHWQPVAPSARVDVRLEVPALSWQGRAYLDSNWGEAPLEDAFVHWEWSRRHEAGRTVIAYDAVRRDGGGASLCLAVEGSGKIAREPAEPFLRLPQTLWRIPRTLRSPDPVQNIQTLEDTPFYARSLAATARGDVMHESLSLDRLKQPLIRAMLPFRMPRALF